MKNLIKVKGYCNHFVDNGDDIVFKLRHTTLNVCLQGDIVPEIALNQTQYYDLNRDDLTDMYTLCVYRHDDKSYVRFSIVTSIKKYYILNAFTIQDTNKKVEQACDYDHIIDAFQKADRIESTFERRLRSLSPVWINDHYADVKDRLSRSGMESHDTNGQFFTELRLIISERTGFGL